MSHPSIITLWDRYRLTEPRGSSEAPLAEHFCDNEEDANICVGLILKGLKKASSSALVAYQEAGEALPQPGKLLIVTDWAEKAKALIQTHTVTVRRFSDVPVSFAKLEGEGDGTLAWWRNARRTFWERTLSGHVVDDNMYVVCEEFEVVLTA